MSKKLLATTALVTLISAPAYAEGLYLDVGLDTTVDAGIETSASGDNDDNGGSADADLDAGADVSADANADLNSENGDSSLSADLSGDAILATELLGEEVHTTANADVQVVGDVNDVVMDDEGNADWIIVGVGGFLGIGEKEVALSADQIAWAEINNEEIVVTQKTQAELEAAAEFDREQIEQNGEYSADDLSWTAEGEARLSAELE